MVAHRVTRGSNEFLNYLLLYRVTNHTLFLRYSTLVEKVRILAERQIQLDNKQIQDI